MVISLPDEIWKDIPGYECLYQASNFGRVKALDKTYYLGHNHLSSRHKQEELLVAAIGAWGYATVSMSNGISRKKWFVHRVVAFTFLLNPLEVKQVNHKDGNKLNNVASNLEWVTASQNSQHSYNTGLSTKRFGQKHHNSKLVLDTQTGIYYESLREAAEAKNIDNSVLCNLLRSKHKVKKNNTGLVYV